MVQIDLYQGLGGIHPVRDSRNRISVRAWGVRRPLSHLQLFFSASSVYSDPSSLSTSLSTRPSLSGSVGVGARGFRGISSSGLNVLSGHIDGTLSSAGGGQSDIAGIAPEQLDHSGHACFARCTLASSGRADQKGRGYRSQGAQRVQYLSSRVHSGVYTQVQAHESPSPSLALLDQISDSVEFPPHVTALPIPASAQRPVCVAISLNPPCSFQLLPGVRQPPNRPHIQYPTNASQPPGDPDNMRSDSSR